VTGSPSTGQAEQAFAEFDRQRRLVDQTLTMQASIRDRDQRLSKLLTCTILVASVIGVAFAFAGQSSSITIFGIVADRSTWLGWLAVGTASLTLVELAIDRRGAAQHRSVAVQLLASLKAEYRRRPDEHEIVSFVEQVSPKYNQVMESVPPVSERLFNRLKARHLHKVEVSKVLSSNPGMPHRKAVRNVNRRFRGSGQSGSGGGNG
jgi:hypothetical protein